MKKIITNTHNQEDDILSSLHNQEQTDVEKFLDIQEHIYDYSDEELEELFKDSNLKKDLKCAVMLKQSYPCSDDIDVSSEWQAFAKKHYRPIHQWRKVAAIFFGIIVTSGIIFAAVSLHHPKSEQASAVVKDSQKAHEEQEKASSIQLTSKTDTTSVNTSEATKVFDNVELEVILTAMSQYYGKEVKYKSEGSRHLHFHYEWNKLLSLEQNIKVLNSFEHVNIMFENDMIIVE